MLSETTDRYVASTFDLTVGTAEYNESSDLAFKVDGIYYKELKNRWNGTKAVGEDNKPYDTPIEYAWLDDEKLSSAMVTEGANKNVDPDGIDARSGKNYLPAEVGEPFEIELTTNYPKETVSDRIEWYYVVLDKNFGMSSTPSEWNAWISYGYEGLGVMTKASDKLKITVSQKDNQGNPYGDVIGFRVFAVNYDGTLVDPDGKAFYIKLGDRSNIQNKETAVTALYEGENFAVIPVDKFAPLANAVDKNGDPLGAANTKFEAAIVGDGASDYTTTGAKIYFQLCEDAKGTKAVNDWSKAKYVKIILNQANLFADGGKFVAKLDAYNPDNKLQLVNSLTVTVTKNMPTTADVAGKFKYKPGMIVGDVFNCYLQPSATNWFTASDEGTLNLSNVATMDYYNSDDYYSWLFADSKADSKDATKTADVEVVTKTNYTLTIASKDDNHDFINSTTEHATTISYVFKNISLRKVDNVWDTPTFYVTVDDINTIYSSPLNNNVHDYAWTKAEYLGADNKTMVSVDANYIVYGNETGEDSNPDLVKAKKSYADLIMGTNTYNNSWFGGTLKDRAKDIFVGNVDITIGNGEYYDVTFDKTTGSMTFKFKGDRDPNLTADVNTTMNIKITDTFGHEYTYNVPFVIKKR